MVGKEVLKSVVCGGCGWGKVELREVVICDNNICFYGFLVGVISREMFP